MPQMTLPGVVLGLRSKPYDFTDDTGQRNAGVSHRLFLWDVKATEPVEVTVPQDVLGLVHQLEVGNLVTLNVEPRARGNRVTYSFQGVESVDGSFFARVRLPPPRLPDRSSCCDERPGGATPDRSSGRPTHCKGPPT